MKYSIICVLTLLLLSGCGGGSKSNPEESVVNNAPVIDALDSLTINELSTQNLQTTISDPDGDSLTLAWSQVSGVSLALENVSGANLSITAPEVQADEETVIRLVATDEHGRSASKDIAVTIINVNELPVAIGSNDVTAVIGAEVEINGSASYDEDGEIVTYQWSVASPDGDTHVYAVNSSTFSFTPDMTGQYEVTLVVTDNNGGTSSDLIVIIVEDDNRPPVAEAGDDQNIILGSGVNVNGSDSYDPDGDVISYQWTLETPINSKAEINAPNSAAVTFVPDVSGTYIAWLTVKDTGGLTHTDSVTILVDTANLPPVAIISVVHDVEVGTFVELNGSSSYDPENSSILFSWVLYAPDGSSAVLSDSTSVSPGLSVDIEGTYRVTLAVSDGVLSSEIVEVQFTAYVDNIAPVAQAGNDQTVQPGDTVLLDAGASYDENGDSLTFKWEFVSFPENVYPVLINANTSSPTFIADVEGDYVVSVTVSDGILSATDNILVSAVTQSITIWWMEQADNGEQRAQYAWPFSGYSYGLSGYVEEGDEFILEAPYNLTATGRDYVIRISAVDKNGVTTAFFHGLYDGQIIHAGETVEFTYGFNRTYGERADIEFSIEVEELDNHTWHYRYENAWTN
ncbi:PKD domain-containing protein [Aestuariibacter sp. GS-14]|uniref:PKD domain-containing protein n=1 Tax=Aestuariibacter sp. GS-14 TaxID=2590670 RepID=UPI00112AB7DB|nr:PKD domain-containing protein [Aestuariibacter sp. GS-14]TPV59088.1 PKD domain-containing protein [Aestuariibacter sp. GS-14]